MLTLLVLMGMMGVSGGLALAATFKVESLLAVALWVVLAGPVLVGLAVIAPYACGALTPGTGDFTVSLINPNTGELTNNPVDASGYGIGS